MNYKILILIISILNRISAVNPDGSKPEHTCAGSSSPSGTGPSQETEPILEHGCSSGVFVNTFKLRLVFDWWYCDSAWKYGLTLVGLFGFAMASPCFKAYREILRRKAMRSYVFDCFLTHLMLFLFALFVYILDFLLMLIVMSFNVGVFLAVTSGYAVGYVLSSLAFTSYHRVNSDNTFARMNDDCC